MIASGLCLSNAYCLGNDVRGKETRKPGRPPYVRTREEKTEGKIIEMLFRVLVLNKDVCVFCRRFFTRQQSSV